MEKGQIESGEVENSNKEMPPPPTPTVDSSPTDESTTEPPLRQPAKSRVIRRRPGRRMNKAKVKVGRHCQNWKIRVENNGKLQEQMSHSVLFLFWGCFPLFVKLELN